MKFRERLSRIYFKLVESTAFLSSRNEIHFMIWEIVDFFPFQRRKWSRY